MPRARRIFLSIANELSPVILISGGPPGIVTYWIIAIVEFDRRNILLGVRSRTCARATSFLPRGKESVSLIRCRELPLFFIGGMQTGQESFFFFILLQLWTLLFAVLSCRCTSSRRAATGARRFALDLSKNVTGAESRMRGREIGMAGVTRIQNTRWCLIETSLKRVC